MEGDFERAGLERSLPLSEPRGPEKEQYVTKYQQPTRLLLFGFMWF